MTDGNQLRTIAIVGASGNVGSAALKELLATNRFAITLILRPESKTATLPSSSAVTLKHGSWDDAAFLQDRLEWAEIVSDGAEVDSPDGAIFAAQ